MASLLLVGAAGGGQPEVLALPRIAGQLHTSPPLRIEALPRDGESQGIENSQRAEQHGALVFFAAQRRQHRAGLLVVVQPLFQRGTENRVRAQLEEDVVSRS